MKFKVGDKVICMAGDEYFKDGQIETVLYIDGIDDVPYFISNSDGEVRLSGIESSGWWHMGENFELYTTDEQVSSAIKFDSDKNRLELLPVRPIIEIGKVMTFGASKYADRNWEKGFAWSRPYAACLRHLFAWFCGEDKDPESGLSHLAHAGCCIMFLLEYEQSKAGSDDRPKVSNAVD